MLKSLVHYIDSECICISSGTAMGGKWLNTQALHVDVNAPLRKCKKEKINSFLLINVEDCSITWCTGLFA